MGIDLYIIKIYKDRCLFNGTLDSVRRGYFRDSSYDGSLFSFIRSNTSYEDLSWWNLKEDKEWFNRRKNMTLEGAKDFLKLMHEIRDQIYSRDKFQLLCNDERIIALNCFDVIEYKEWLECLIAFLELAIKKKSTIRWS